MPGTTAEAALQVLRGQIDVAIAAFGQALVAARTLEERDRIAAEFHRFRFGALAAVQPALGADKPPEWFEVWSGSQSRAFAIDMLPFLFDHMRRYPAGHRFSILDVGCGTGHGSHLLALLFERGILGYHAEITGIDIVGHWHDHIAVACPYLRHRVGDIFDLGEGETWDIVICSHTIEHVPDWQGFCRRLRQLARQCVILTAPFDEPRHSMVPGHLHAFTMDDLTALEPRRLEVKGSLGWGPLNSPPSQVFVMELAGEAQGVFAPPASRLVTSS